MTATVSNQNGAVPERSTVRSAELISEPWRPTFAVSENRQVSQSRDEDDAVAQILGFPPVGVLERQRALPGAGRAAIRTHDRGASRPHGSTIAEIGLKLAAILPDAAERAPRPAA